MILNINQLKANRLTRIAYADTLFKGNEGEIYSYKLALSVDERTGSIINKVYFLRKINDTEFIAIPNNTGFEFDIIQRDGVPLRNINGEEVYQFNAERTDVLVDENGNPLQRLQEYSRNENAFLPLLNPSIDLTIMNFLGNHPKPIVEDESEI
jgi:hypothetical protein